VYALLNAAVCASADAQRALTVVLEFRISGKGRRFFGDGLALWIVQPEKTHDSVWQDDFYFGQ
jgi:Legume-like lectin family